MQCDLKSLYLVVNFDDFLQNNNIFMQGNHTCKRHQPRKKFIFWQLVMNFLDFCQSNRVFVQKKRGREILKHKCQGKFILWQIITNFVIFRRIIAYLYKTTIHLKKSSSKKVYISTAVKNHKFCWFLMKLLIFWKKKKNPYT